MINYKKYMRVKSEHESHALLSASGSERWLGCAASISQMQRPECPPSVENPASVNGTNTHTLLEFRMKEGLDAPLSKEFKRFIDWNEEREVNVRMTIAFIVKQRKKLMQEYGVRPTLLAEQKVELPGVGFGTSDIIMYIPNKILWVMDYKNGKSIVHPEENSQGLYYAVAAAIKLECTFPLVHITIIQPNAASSRGPIRTWKTDWETIKEARKMFIRGAKFALSDEGATTFQQNEKWCFFCPAKSICPERVAGRESKDIKRWDF